MTTSTVQKDVHKLLQRYGKFRILHTKRHIKIISPETGGFIITSSSSSDWRFLKKLERDVRLLCKGVGYGYQQLAIQKQQDS